MVAAAYLPLALHLLLGQAPDPAAAPPPAAPSEKSDKPEGTPAPPPDGTTHTRHGPASAEEVSKQLEKIKQLPPSEAGQALDELRKHSPRPGDTAAGKDDKDGKDAKEGPLMSEADEVKYEAHSFFAHLIAGDARGVVLQSGFPFYLEDRKLELPEELHQEWLKNLRSKRTDLLTLYDIEVLTPAEMEKKFGKPPARLASMPWKNAKTYLAIGNLSGHAAVAVYRQNGPHVWQVVGYTD